jgi:hypothetical protein
VFVEIVEMDIENEMNVAVLFGFPIPFSYSLFVGGFIFAWSLNTVLIFEGLQ